MKCIRAVGALVINLLLVTVDARDVSVEDPWSAVKWRWRRQSESLRWNCDDRVDGCWVTMSCRTNLDLDLDSLVCHLDGRDFECMSEQQSLSFKFEANLATVNNGEYHRMAISVRGTLGRQQFTLPWNFRFRVDQYYCSSSLPTSATPITVVLTTAAPEVTTPVPVVTVETTITTTQRPTTQPVTQRPTTQRPTTQRPTTQRPTTQTPTTQRPTLPPTTQPPDRPPVATCTTGRNSAGDLVISCTSDQNIQSIAYEVNGNPTGTVYGNVVTISDQVFNEGSNSIELSVNYANGQSYIIVLSYEVNRQLVAALATERPCVLNCSGRYTFADGMTVFCTVDNDPTGEGITAIVYNANNRGVQLADEIPTFRIGVELFQSGLNQIEIIVSHDVCGRASLNLRFHLPEPVGICRISCNYRVVNSSLEFKCDVNNGGSFRSAGYTINGPPPYSVDIPPGATRMDFQIPLSRFTEGRRNTLTLLFETLCSGRVQQAQTSVPITLPPPSSFRVTVISCDPLNTDPSFPVSLDIRADTEADQVVVRASSTTQSILLIQWSINGSSDDFRVSSILQLSKTSFREGRNSLALDVYGVGGSRVQTTCTLDIRM